MNASIEATCTDLSDGAMLRLVNRRGARISVRRGRVWITQDYDRRDLVLDAGEFFEIDRDGLALVQALGASCVQVDADPPASGPIEKGTANEPLRARAEGSASMRLQYSTLSLYFQARRDRGERLAFGLFRLGRACAGGFEHSLLHVQRLGSALVDQGRSVLC